MISLIESWWSASGSNPGVGIALAALLLTLASAAITGVFVAGKWLWGLYQKRLSIGELTSTTSKRFDDVVQLYRQQIDVDQQIDPDLIREWIEDVEIRARLNNTLLVARRAGIVVGFLQLMWTEASDYVCVTYFAADDLGVGRSESAAQALTRVGIEVVLSRSPSKKAIVFEVEAATPQADLVRARRDRARQRKFKELFGRCGYHAGVINAEYYQPEIPSEHLTGNQHPMKLMYVPLNKERRESLLGEELCAVLHFLYSEIYRDVYRADPDLHVIYQDELKELLANCTASFSEVVQVH